jgi:hypothetical protein
MNIYITKKYLEEAMFNSLSGDAANDANRMLNSLVTIRDNRKKNNIYNEVSQLLQTHNFVHSNIKIREDVRIKTNN